MHKVTFIISPARADLYESLRKTMSGEANVEVLIDRRAWPTVPITPLIAMECRQAEGIAERRSRWTRRSASSAGPW